MGDLQFTMNTHHYITTLQHHYCSQLTARGSQQKNTSIKTISTLVCYIDKRAQQPRAKSQKPKAEKYMVVWITNTIHCCGRSDKDFACPTPRIQLGIRNEELGVKNP
jgi:hypothetical protein